MCCEQQVELNSGAIARQCIFEPVDMMGQETSELLNLGAVKPRSCYAEVTLKVHGNHTEFTLSAESGGIHGGSAIRIFARRKPGGPRMHLTNFTSIVVVFVKTKSTSHFDMAGFM